MAVQGDYREASKSYSKALRYLDPSVFEDSSPAAAELERLGTACLPLLLNRYISAVPLDITNESSFTVEGID